jgi:hypothetical protein
MVDNNFTSQLVTQQLSQRSGQVAISTKGGNSKFINSLNNQVISGPEAGSVILANPQKPNDPKLTAKALDSARGYYAGRNVPPEFVEAIASVAAYLSNVSGIPVNSMLSPTSVSLELISAYNRFKPKGSQVGILSPQLNPTWFNNPILRGSITAALKDQA